MSILKTCILIVLITVYEYNLNGQNTELEDLSKKSAIAIKFPVTQKYNAFGQPVKYIFSNDAEINFFYDNIGRLIRRVMPDDSEVTYNFDRNLLVTKIEGLRQTRYDYDDFGRLVKKTISQDNQVLLETRTYDQNGNLLSISENNKNTVSFLYDRFGKKLLETGPKGTVKYLYDNFGRLMTREAEISSAPQKFQTNYSYGSSNNQIYIISSPSGKFYFNWSKTTGKLHQIEYEYSNRNTYRLYAVKTSFDLKKKFFSKSFVMRGAKSMNIIEHQYNQSNQLVNGNVFSLAWEYRYNQYDQIISAVNNQGKNLDFGYDQSGNCVKYGNENLTYNRMWQINESGYEYDSWGNLIKSPGIEYEYDLKNRLITVCKDDLTISYTYDPMNQLLERTVTNPSGRKIQTDFLMSSMIEYARVSNGKAIYHTFPPNITDEIQKPIVPYLLASFSSDGENIYFISSFDESIVAAFKPTDNGTIGEKIHYTPYGEILNSKDSGNLTYGFKMMLNIGEGLYFSKGRIYSPQLHSYLTPDRNPFLSKNPYTFEYNHPVGHKLKSANDEFDFEPMMYQKIGLEPPTFEELILNNKNEMKKLDIL